MVYFTEQIITGSVVYISYEVPRSGTRHVSAVVYISTLVVDLLLVHDVGMVMVASSLVQVS